MSRERLRVLVLDGASNAARTVVQSLGYAGHECWLAAAGERGSAFASRYPARELEYPDPLFDPRGFVEWVDAVHGGREFDLILPITEATLVPLHEALRSPSGGERSLPPRIAALRPVVVLPPAAALETVLDKEALHQTASALGIPVPASRFLPAGSAVDAYMPDAWPVVVKPQRSKIWIAGRGTNMHVQIARDAKVLRHVLEGILPVVGAQIQEWRPGKGAGIELLMREGERVLTFAHERLHELPLTGGGSTYRRSIAPPPALLEASTALLSHLRWHGAAMVEFRIDPTSDRWILLEVNGRFWGSLPLAQFAGVDFPAALVDLARGRPVTTRAGRSGTVWARNFTGDVQWGKAALRDAKHPDPLVRRPGLARSCFEWGRIFTGRETWDGASWRDPSPILNEMASALGREGRLAIGRAHRRIRDRRRRRVSLAQIAKRRGARRILVVCYGNLCRSPYAGARLAAAGEPHGLEVRTAGFSRHTGRVPPEFFQKLTAARGVDLRAHRSAHLDSQALAWADLVVIMDAANERLLASRDARRARRAVLLGALDPEGGADVRDPYELPVQEVADVLAQIDRCVEALVKVLGPAREPDHVAQ